MAESKKTKDIARKRSANLGAVTRHLQTLEQLLELGHETYRSDIDDALDKLLGAKEKFDMYHRSLVDLYRRDNMSAAQISISAGKATANVVTMLDRLEEARKESVVSRSPVPSSGTSSPGDAMRGLRAELDQAQGEAAMLRDELHLTNERYAQDTAYFRSTIDSLVKDMERLKLLADVRERPDAPGQHGRTGQRITFGLPRDHVINPNSYHMNSTTVAYGTETMPCPDDDRCSVANHGSTRQPPRIGRGRARGIRWSAATTEPSVGHQASNHSHNRSYTPDLSCDNSMVYQQLLDQSAAQHRSLIASMHTPRVKIKTFTGDPLDFSSFTTSFDELVAEAATSDRARLMMLHGNCSEPVQAAISCCFHMSPAEGYAAARDILRRKYGTPFLVTQAWLQKVMSAPSLRTPEAMEAFATDLDCCYNSLFTLGSLAELECTNSIRLIVTKLPPFVRGKWRKMHREAQRDGAVSVFPLLLRLIKDCAEEMSDPAYGEAVISRIRNTYDTAAAPNSRFPRPSLPGGFKRASNHYADDWPAHGEDEDPGSYEDAEDEVMAISRSNRACSSCGSGQHFTSRCHRYKELSHADRLSFAKQKRLCLLCLSCNHATDACLLPWRCQEKECGQRHHTSLHGAFVEPSTKKQEVNCTSGEDEKGEVYLTMNSVSLPLTPVTLIANGKEVNLYALLDPGSTMTLCTQRVMGQLGLESLGQDYVRVSTVTGSDRLAGKKVNMQVSELGGTKVFPVCHALAVAQLPVSLNHLAVGSKLERWDHLKHLDLPVLPTAAVDILIGQDNAHLLKPGPRVDGGELEPYAVKTPLGWTIYGGLDKDFDPINESVYHCAPCCDITESIEDKIDKFFASESVPEPPKLHGDERKVYEMWDREFKIEEGHVVLPIPFKENVDELECNFVMAVKSLECLGRRLDKNPTEREQYRVAMKRYFDQRHSEPVPRSEWKKVKGVWYLLHHGTDHPRKPGVTRPVMNGAGKFRGLSLNMVAHKGPDLMNPLTDVLTGFREFENASTADVEQMFMQVIVPIFQRDFLKYVIWKDFVPGGEIMVCRFRTHVFGAIWSPSACNFALQKLARLYATDEAVRHAILKRFYVDDLLNCNPTPESTSTCLTGVQGVLQKGGFNLSKVMSNSREVLSLVDPQKRAKELARINLMADKLPAGYSLGQQWRPEDDSFAFSLIPEPKPFTRRGMTSTVASLFDPLGLLAPFILPAKKMMQLICKKGCTWDSDLPLELAPQWTRWLEQLPQIEAYKVRRWFGCDLTTTNFLACFSDASEMAMGAVSYLVVRDKSDKVVSTIAMSKTKLAPKEVQPIPRLELAAAVIAVRIETALKRAFSVMLGESRFWTDSVLVLWFLTKDPSELNTYSANRVSFIVSNTKFRQWNHIPGVINPADLTSRGASVTELTDNELWLEGPPFLKESPDKWPASKIDLSQVRMASEIKKPRVVFTVEQKPPTLEEHAVKKFLGARSTLTAQIRIASRIRRFVQKYHGRPHQQGLLMVEELTSAERRLAVLNQNLYFPPGFQELPGIKKLLPRKSDGVWVVGGRCDYAPLPEDVRHPILLPSDCPMASQVMESAHTRVCHAGVDRSLLASREKYWVVGGRRLLKAKLGRCIPCNKVKARAAQQLMSDLPSARLAIGKPAFSRSGVDLFGPLPVVIKRSTVKCYAVLFTCMTCRGVCLDIVEDLTSSAFLNALERFINRKGKPEELWSDNGTNLIGTRAIISTIQGVVEDPVIKSSLAQRGIVWKTNAPAGSHQGGVWEGMIRSTRAILFRLLSNRVVSEDLLRTTLSIAEGLVNSRPLTRVNDDPTELAPLTPNHFIHQRPFTPLFSEEFSEDGLRRCWKTSQRLASIFWKRWLAQYLPELQRRAKWNRHRPGIKIGELVLLVSNNAPRGKWPMGIVRELIPGRDGRVRNVRVKTADGILLRPIQKVVRLEAAVT